jgi:nucleoside-diphosphate-sugar epimerase
MVAPASAEHDVLVKVMVTGGTGYVGSHITKALLDRGHDVKLLVRRPEQVAVSLSPLGAEADDVVVGDVLDPAAVDAAMSGCDAVVHAAAVFSLHPRERAMIRRTNVQGTEIVLGGAVRAGLDPVVHVSSTVALVRWGGSGPDLPLGDMHQPYAISKVESELVARRLQQDGSAVVSIYPGGVFGPDDPYLGDQAYRLSWVARGLFPLWARGGFHVVDVRDVAAVVAACMEPGRGPRRFVVPGHHMTGAMLYSTVSAALGRKRPLVRPPDWTLVLATHLMDAMNRLMPRGMYYPADIEGLELSRRDTRLDDVPARRELGIEPTPFDETIRDTLNWLVDAGHLPARYRPR